MATDREANAALYFIKRVKQDPVAQTKLLALLSAAASSQRAREQ